MADDLRLPFLFVPRGVPEPPEVAAFKARHPGWFSIPATFVPRAEPDSDDDTVPLGGLDAPDPPFREAVSPAPHARRLDRGTSMAASVRAFQRASEIHGDPVAALRALKENPDAFADPASTQGYVAADPERWIGQPSVGSGQCVALVQQATGAPLAAQWRRGALVKGNMALRPGIAIATFDPDGRYGNHTDGRSHAAIYLGQDAHGIRVIDQWIVRKNGKIVWTQAPHARTIKFDDSHPDIENANRYYVIN